MESPPQNANVQNGTKRKYYYLIYFPPKDPNQRSRIKKELVSMDCVRLHSSLWKIPMQNMAPSLNLVRTCDPVVFKRSREIFPPKINFDKHMFDLGSVALIAYRLHKPSSKKRTVIGRMLRRVPYIKMGSCLLLIPYLKSSRLNAYQGSAILQDKLFKFLDEEGVEAHRLTHLKIIYPSSHENLIKAMIDYETRICVKLVFAIKSLTSIVNHTENHDITKLQKLLSFYKSRYTNLQGIGFFMYHTMNIDLRPSLKRVYNALMQYKQAIEGKVEQLNVAE
ncbi:MAG: hypothetical protein V1915_03485 [Candidatus Bathyarchaeota archaeon]